MIYFYKITYISASNFYLSVRNLKKLCIFAVFFNLRLFYDNIS
jgi:hypothetical protein